MNDAKFAAASKLYELDGGDADLFKNADWVTKENYLARSGQVINAYEQALESGVEDAHKQDISTEQAAAEAAAKLDKDEAPVAPLEPTPVVEAAPVEPPPAPAPVEPVVEAAPVEQPAPATEPTPAAPVAPAVAPEPASTTVPTL